MTVSDPIDVNRRSALIRAARFGLVGGLTTAKTLSTRRLLELLEGALEQLESKRT